MNRTNEFKKQVAKRGRPLTPTQTPREDFTKISTTLNAELNRMKLFLRRTYSSYVQPIHYDLNFTSRHPLPTTSTTATSTTTKSLFTSREREHFDKTMVAFLQKCKASLQQMKIVATQESAQNRAHQEHRKLVAFDLDRRLKEMATDYAGMVQLAASETMRVSMTLDMGVASSAGEGSSAMRRRKKTRKRWDNSEIFSLAQGGGGGGGGRERQRRHEHKINGEQHKTNATDSNSEHSSAKRQPNEAEPRSFVSNEEERERAKGGLTRDSLEQESKMLERSLSTKLDATKQLESQFIELANMTKMFTAHVEDQHDQVNTIQEDTNDALDYADSGLKELEKASTGTSKYFMMMLFLLLSFIILFLDWWSY
jgi:hypothetical protein